MRLVIQLVREQLYKYRWWLLAGMIVGSIDGLVFAAYLFYVVSHLPPFDPLTGPPILAVSEPVPPIGELLSFGHSGTYYLAKDENGQEILVSVYHVIQWGKEKSLFTPLTQPVTAVDCTYLDGDGSCRLEFAPLAKIRRDVKGAVPSEVSVYNPDLKVWMTFKTEKLGGGIFRMRGLPMDLDHDGVADVRAFVCRGQSGSPVVTSENGVPIVTDGYLTSHGEVVFMVFTNKEEAERQRCASWVEVYALDLPDQLDPGSEGD